MDDRKAKEIREKQVDTGKQGTNEPWKHPGQSSQQPGQKAPNPRPRTNEDNKTA
jgi:hypothetical protein